MIVNFTYRLTTLEQQLQTLETRACGDRGTSLCEQVYLKR